MALREIPVAKWQNALMVLCHWDGDSPCQGDGSLESLESLNQAAKFVARVGLRWKPDEGLGEWPDVDLSGALEGCSQEAGEER